MSDVKSMNWAGIVTIVCALIAVVGVFLSWLDIDSILGGTTYSGWDIYSNDLFSAVDYNFAGLGVVVCGVLALIFAAVATFYKNQKADTILKALTIILSLIGIVFAALGYTSLSGDLSIDLVFVSSSVGYGLYVSLVFMVLTFLLGIVDVVMSRKNKTESA